MIHLPDSRLASVQTIIDAIPNPIFAKNRLHQVVLLNASACAFLGYSRETLLSRSDSDLFPVEQVRSFHAADDRVFETGVESETEQQITDGTGRIRHVITRKRMARLEGAEYLVASVTDISASREAEAQTRHLAFHDPLTGLPNRRLFEEKLDECLRSVTANTPIAILVLDLDGFKAVNDTHGHAVGDRALRMFASKISAVLRTEDIMARIGGDEFAIIMPAIGSLDEPTHLARRVVATLKEPFVIDEAVVGFGVDIGIAVAPDDGSLPGDLLKRADRALYRAKAAGRSSICFFEADMDLVIRRRFQIEQEFRSAIASDTIVPHYQPLVSLYTSRIIGFEALARWESKSLGHILPDVFIPIAEDAGLISLLSTRLLSRACRDAATWPETFFLAFNVSPVALRDPGLGLRILATLAKVGLNPRRLELEITESALVENIVVARTTIDQLRQAGVRIALDDFGTGYATLTQLLSFRLDKIKIDRSFVSRLDQSEEARVIVRAILGLAKGFGLRTTAEGVENLEQQAFLKKNGCNEGQGYLFGRAIPATDIPALLNLRPNPVADELIQGEPDGSELSPSLFPILARSPFYHFCSNQATFALTLPNAQGRDRQQSQLPFYGVVAGASLRLVALQATPWQARLSPYACCARPRASRRCSPVVAAKSVRKGANFHLSCFRAK
jgi:diguanylate cyclase (GGDEF)-like protein/PAS domain S-box-containing protein